MGIGLALFEISKSKPGSWVVGASFAWLSGLMPVRNVYVNRHIKAFFHPRPISERHVLVVPKYIIRGLLALHQRSDREAIWNQIQNGLMTVTRRTFLAGDGGGRARVFCNGGDRQDVTQLHWHVIDPAASVRSWKPAEARTSMPVVMGGSPPRGQLHVVVRAPNDIDASLMALSSMAINGLGAILESAAGFTFVFGDAVDGLFPPTGQPALHVLIETPQ